MSYCVFCNIINDAAPARMIAYWPDAIAFTPLNPVVTGHTLVIPRAHVRDAVEDPAITGLVMARAAELASGCGTSNILTSVGVAATQSVMHLHIHVVPRYAGDQLMVPWGTTGDPHAPHRCKGMDQPEAELAEARPIPLPRGADDPREPIIYPR